jgi:hypothetical protein
MSPAGAWGRLATGIAGLAAGVAIGSAWAFPFFFVGALGVLQAATRT